MTLVIGLISGTSADGIDAALVGIKPARPWPRLRLQIFETVPYPRRLKARLLAIDSVAELSHLNVYIGELFAQAAIRIAAKAGIGLSRIAAIGSHGQTVAHQPDLRHEGLFRIRSTLQIGEPSVIAERTGITTVADFRPRDIAAGGHGAPLTPYLHRVLFQHPSRARLIVNIGGISNLTYLPAVWPSEVQAPSRDWRRRWGTHPVGAGQGRPQRSKGPNAEGSQPERRGRVTAGDAEQRGAWAEEIVAFDCGPGNMLMDGLVAQITRGRAQMDRGGRLAARGRVHDGLLRRLLSRPFMRQRPPKTTGREAFGHVLIERLTGDGWTRRLAAADLLATATAFTAEAIALHVRRWVPHGPLDEVIVVGGGANNPSLMAMLQHALAPMPIRRSDVLGVNGKAIEAMAFALLAYETLRGVPTNFPSVTGARRPVVLGKIIPAGPSGVASAWRVEQKP